MTVIVGITTPDGVVLASDSRTTQSEEGAHRILSDSAQKVFEIGRFGVATSGLAFIGGNTIAGLMDQFVAQLGDQAAEEVNAFTDALGEFFTSRFTAWWGEDGETWDTEELGFPLIFLIAGYDAQGIGHIHRVLIPGPGRAEYSPNTTERGAVWEGQTDVINRLLKGVDWSQLHLPEEELSEEAIEQIVDDLGSLQYKTLFPVTVQDAVDYSSFLIRTTIDMQRFSDGTLGDPGLVPGCGGPVQILVVERSRTVWAAKPELRVT
jgi:Proteasome subunit